MIFYRDGDGEDYLLLKVVKNMNEEDSWHYIMVNLGTRELGIFPSWELQSQHDMIPPPPDTSFKCIPLIDLQEDRLKNLRGIIEGEKHYWGELEDELDWKEERERRQGFYYEILKRSNSSPSLSPTWQGRARLVRSDETRYL